MMPPWLQAILNFIFGGAKQSQTDQQLGKTQQELADAQATEKETADAEQIDRDNSRLTDDELAAKLRGS